MLNQSLRPRRSHFVPPALNSATSKLAFGATVIRGFHRRSRAVQLIKLGAIVAGLLLIAGCSGEAEQKVALRRSNLTQLGLGYRQYYSEQGRAPSDAAELAQFMSSAADESAVQEAVKSLEEGDVVMFWDGVLEQDSDQGEWTLGFEASVPGSGGYIVTADGSIRLVTARQFAETPTVAIASPESP
jgi:hypothetical protein